MTAYGSDYMAAELGEACSLFLSHGPMPSQQKTTMTHLYKSHWPQPAGLSSTGKMWLHVEMGHWNVSIEVPVQRFSRHGYRAKMKNVALSLILSWPTRCHPQYKAFLICLFKSWWPPPTELSPTVVTAGCIQLETMVYFSWGS